MHETIEDDIGLEEALYLMKDQLLDDRASGLTMRLEWNLALIYLG